MTFSRYTTDSQIRNGRAYGTAKGVNEIRKAISLNQISMKTQVFSSDERLDIIAGQEYGDSSLWWVIAAASNVGWGLQVPAGTQIRIPTDIQQISDIIT